MPLSSDNDKPGPIHVCLQSSRLLRIEDELAQVEARRREDASLTASTLRGMASEFGDAIDKITEAGEQVRSVARQIRTLFARVNTLASRLDGDDT